MSSIDRYRIRPGSDLSLSDFDPRDRTLYPDISKARAKDVLGEHTARLAGLQRALWAEGRQSLLVVLQAMDTGGKDGTIRKVFSGVNPQGVDVTGFGVPSETELAHDYLWRVHARTPGAGRIAVFNRSHYEDVLVVRVRRLVPRTRWVRRFGHIRDFEQMLSDEGTTIRKIMLHISKDEQKERLEARLADPTKGYKFNASDLETRERWDQYMSAYEEALSETSTEAAPWYVVPADRKWYRNLVVTRILIDALESMDPQFPEAEFDPSSIVIE